MTFTWHISKLGLTDKMSTDNVLLENAIVNVKWKRIAEDADGTLASYVGNTGLTVSLEAANFVALNDVTAEQVTSWIEEEIGAAGLSKMDSILETKIERKRLRNVSPSW
jgi:hypothetical protein